MSATDGEFSMICLGGHVSSEARGKLPLRPSPPLYLAKMIGRRKILICILFGVCVILLSFNIFFFKNKESQKRTQTTISQTLSRNSSNDTSKGNKCSSDSQSMTYALHHGTTDGVHLRHVKAVFDRLGYNQVDPDCNWDVLWTFEYPFKIFRLRNLKPHQKVNHFPGTGTITNKLDLSTSGIPYVPQSFILPKQKNELLEYAKKNPNTTFIQKGNQHRKVTVKKIQDLDLNSKDVFVQEFLSKTLLIDGHRFVIGVYIVLTSINPLRVYMYNGDVLFRFCPEKYHPFDPKKLRKYVCGNDYLPIWEVPSLKSLYSEQGYSMKETFNSFLKSKGKDSSIVWRNVYKAIQSTFLLKEPKIQESLEEFKYSKNFFEMFRMDLVIDEDLNVFIVEVNMSPNLSSVHFPPNQLLYEQLIFNTLSLVGLAQPSLVGVTQLRSSLKEEMRISMKNILVFPELCNSAQCEKCVDLGCDLCMKCLKNSTVSIIKDTYIEHMYRFDCRRVYPPPMSSLQLDVEYNAHSEEYLSPENNLLAKWFLGKCASDQTWCT